MRICFKVRLKVLGAILLLLSSSLLLLTFTDINRYYTSGNEFKFAPGKARRVASYNNVDGPKPVDNYNDRLFKNLSSSI